MEYYGNHDKWIAGGGTTALGTIGTVTGGAALLGNVLNGNGLFGAGGNTLQKENSALLAEVGQLKAEKYSDAQDAKLFDAVRVLEQKQSETATAVICLQKELTAYEISQKEIQELRQQLTDSKICGVAKDLNCLAGTVENMAGTFNGKINAINATIGGFTKTVILESAICDTDCGNTQ